MVQNIHEGIEGLKEIRILGKEKYFHRMLEKNAKVFAEASINANIVSTMPRYFLELILIVFIVLLVFKSIFFDQNFNDLLPTISMFGIAAMRLAPSTSQIISSISRLRHNAHSIDLLYDDLKSLKGLHSSEKGHISMSRVEKDQPCKPFHSIELQQVQFTYPKTNKLVLDNLSITIRAGDSIGLIGSSGSGKTTMVDLLLGLLEPNKGKILYNNKPLIKNLADWQSTVGYLPQKVFLIDDTLRKNIALGVDEEEISDNKILEALHQARLTELVMQLPKGINTTLGEHGIRLSGGQRQRVALARAFYHQRSVLIMDESTSALDNETEHEIVEEIKRLKGRKTIIVIAHRLTTLQHCDYIYRMDNGKLVQDGDYESVIKKSNK
jgi:ABC-type bacteriocin/lantibiotic exporter with double-glycine peptidase domain